MPAKSKRITKQQKVHRFKKLVDRLPKRTLFIAIFMLFGLGVIFVKATTPVDSNFITSVADLGKISQPANYLGRDGGDSALLGGKVTWIFGDTLYAPTVPVTGDLFRSATAAIGNISNPTQVTEPLDSRKAPNQLIPHTAAEQAYNIAHKDGNDRYALWPSTIATRSDGNSAWVYFNDLLISGGKWTSQGTGIATLGANSTQANRLPGFLFAANEIPFRKALPVGNMLYVYSGAAGQSLCEVSRVPLDQAATRSAYQFWNGSAWVSSISLAKKVIPCSNLGYAVMYNKALKSYVEALIPNFSKAVYFSYAPSPEGPWSTPIKGFDLPHDAKATWLYAPNMHPELSTDGDKTVFLSYSGGTTAVQLMKINLQPPANGESASKLAAASYGTALGQAPAPKAKAPTSSSSGGAPAPTAETPVPSAATPVAADPAKTAAASTSTRKLSWWQRLNLYMRRHWNAIIKNLSS